MIFVETVIMFKSQHEIIKGIGYITHLWGAEIQVKNIFSSNICIGKTKYRSIFKNKKWCLEKR